MGTYDTSIQKLYIAYFNRPADVLGLAYWNDQIAANGGSTAAVANAFSASNEYKSLYAGKSSAAIVDTIYMNLFGRHAEPDGLVYWGSRLDSGVLNIGNIALSIMTGAQNDDLVSVNNKTTAAVSFTTALDTNAEIVGYSGDAANAVAKSWLTTVTDAASLATAQAALPTVTANVVDAYANANGSSLTLTTGVDTITGTANNDTITATDTTLTALDSIDGGAGVDTLKISDTDGTVDLLSLPTVTNIEKLVVTSIGNLGNVDQDVSGWTGLTSATISVKGFAHDFKVGDTTALTLTNVGGNNLTTHGGSSVNVTNGAGTIGITSAAATTVTVKGGTTVGVTDSSTDGNVLTTLSVDSNAGALTTTTTGALTSVSLSNTTAAATIGNATASHTQNLTLNNVTGGATITDAAATTVNVTTATKASAVQLAVAAATALNVTNAAGLNITGSTLTNVATVTGTGAGAFTADFTAGAGALTAVDMSGSTGANAVKVVATQETYTGGTGADTVTISAVATKTIDGGTGTDEIVVNAASFAANSKIVGFETLGIGTAGNGTFDATGFSALHVGSTLTGDSTFSNVAAGTTLAIDAAPGKNVTYTLKDATGTSDSVHLTFSTATTAGVDFSGKNVDVSGIESVSVSSLGTGTGTNKIKLVDTAATSLTITGGEATTVTLAGATGLVSVDASAVTKAVDLSGVAVSASGATILGSTSAANVLVGGAGADTITGGSAADTITTGKGLDVVTTGGGTAADNVILSVNVNANTYATITDAHKGLILTGIDQGTETFMTAKVTLAPTAVFQDYLNAVVQAGGDASTNGAFGWFQFQGDTYVVESLHDGSGAGVPSFVNNTDLVVKLTGTALDLSKATVGDHILTLA